MLLRLDVCVVADVVDKPEKDLVFLWAATAAATDVWEEGGGSMELLLMREVSPSLFFGFGFSRESTECQSPGSYVRNLMLLLR